MYRLSVKEGDPGRFTFHSDTEPEFVRHLTAEDKEKNRRGEYEWVQKRKANHWFDCCTIAFALADPASGGGVRVKADGKTPVARRRIISRGIE